MKRIALWLGALVALAACAGGWVLWHGVFDVAATRPDSSLAYHLMHYAMRRSVAARAGDIAVPDLEDDGRIARGHALFRQHCQQCHGGPGVAPDPFGRGLRPPATNLAQDGREWPANEIYWVVRHGVRMTAMPAWQYRLGEGELWDVTAFVKHLPILSPAQYQAGPATPLPQPVAAPKPAGHAPDARGGRILVDQFLCATCHAIPGIAGADHTVGPPLDGLAHRTFIAGTLSNTPENLARWLRHPQAIRPGSAMPDLGIDEMQARDMAAFLLTLKDPP